MDAISGWVLWGALAILAGEIARHRGHSWLGFFFLSLLLSPIVGVPAALLWPRNEDMLEQRALSAGKRRKCPNCAELVKVDALVCRYCQRDLPAPEVMDNPPPSMAVPPPTHEVTWGSAWPNGSPELRQRLLGGCEKRDPK